MTSPVGGSGRRGVQSVTGRVAGGGEVDAGGRAFYELSKRLKEVGGTGKGSLRNEMAKALRVATKPLPQAVKAEAAKRFPQRGGLARRVAKRTPRMTARTGVQTAGVRIEDPKGDKRVDEQGRLSHPVFGRRPNVVQRVPEVQGYFSETLQQAAPQVRDDVVQVLEDFARRLPGAQ